MSVMEKRLQLLLDAERYEQVSEEARQSGRSVAAVIREAIDVRFQGRDDEARRRAAAVALLAMTEDNADREVGQDWSEIKRALDDDLMRGVEGAHGA